MLCPSQGALTEATLVLAPIFVTRERLRGGGLGVSLRLSSRLSIGSTPRLGGSCHRIVGHFFGHLRAECAVRDA